MFRSLVLSAGLFLISAANASAHEFWIGPEDFTLSKEQPLVAHLRVGEAFKGSSFANIPAQYERFELRQGASQVRITSRIGDRPAINQTLPQDGMWVVLHETRDSYLTYNDEGQFANFVTHKDLTGVLKAHAARGFEETGFTENYRRYAKSLVAVGEGAGADQNYGMLTEIVALTNPYGKGFDGQMQVQVLYDGAPRADVQLEVYDRSPDGKVRVFTQRTDQAGRATVAVEKGHSYLFDSVTMLPNEPTQENRRSVWTSLRASLTFAVPE